MEKDYNRNEGSDRPRRSDSRDDYHTKKDERQERPAYGERTERKEDSRNRYANNRTEGSSDRGSNRGSNRGFDRGSDRGYNSAPRSFNRERRDEGESYQRRESYRDDNRAPRSFQRSDDRAPRSFQRSDDRAPRSFQRSDDRAPRSFQRNDRNSDGNSYQPRERRDDHYSSPRREEGESYQRRESYRDGNREDNRSPRTFQRSERSFDENSGGGERKVIRKRADSDRPSDRGRYSSGRREISGEAKDRLREKHYSKKKILAHRLKNMGDDAELRLNRFISMGGVCSRRDADQLIEEGRVLVNGEIVQELGMKVHRSDKVEVDGKQITPEKKVYLVLNKPKDYVTTVEDPLNRKTVMDLIKTACKERVYPVGRLDRQTTGVLLFTNDGDLAKKLTHPKYDSKKIYHVFLDKPLSEKDLDAIARGVELEDGFVKADEISYTATDKMEVGLEIHSGKNRIVRRIFEHLGYQIIKLDRVYFSGITKKNVPRGKWRMLTPKEVNMLKIYQ